MSKYLAYFEAGTDRGYQLVNPRHFPTTLPNWSTVSVSDAYSLWGSSTPVATGLSAGLEAIAYAAAAIRSGEEQAMIAGGYDELNLCNASVLATITTTSPAATYPVAGEGVGILLLQSADAVAASGRRPLAAYGATVTRRGTTTLQHRASRRAGAGGTGRTGRCLGRRRAAHRHRGCVPLD